MEAKRVDAAASSDAGGAADLVGRIRAGDSHAEAELVARYGRGVMMVIRRSSGNAAVSDDVYQDTFRITLEKVRRGDLRDPEKLSAFICSTARNLVVEYFRRNPRHDSLAEIEHADSLPHAAPSQLDTLLREEKATIIRQVIDELPTDRDRQLLFRFYVSEEDKETICADFGLTSLHFNRVLHRARERYKELYEKAVSRLERPASD